MSTYDLTVPFGNTHVPNGTKLRIGTPAMFAGDADTGAPAKVTFSCSIGSTSASGVIHCTWEMMLVDGAPSDQADRQATPPVNAGLTRPDRYIVQTVRTLATAATDAIAAWDAGGGNKRAAFKAHLFSAGHLGPGLAAS